ncbi:MAG TPA: HAD family hydrolase [Candidatus Limnocylindria bacterium]|nr:HAD family hydrolase [Candidatus Limnocylindria bacterium]
MRVLVHGLSFGGTRDRIAPAAVGLALRGHRVDWWGGAPPGDMPGTLELVHNVGELLRRKADVVVGGPAHAFATVASGWLVGARTVVLALDRASVATWSPVDRWAWQTIHAAGLIDEAEVEAWRRDPMGLQRDRLALWSPEGSAETPEAGHADTEMLERACERALARQRGHGLRSAVFVDRDGTLVREVGYLADPADIELLPGAAGALRRLQASGAAVVVVSNQSGVGRGLFPLARVHQAMGRLRELLRAAGVELDAIYFCPHRPDAGCPCRKPSPGLLERAADDLQLSLRGSVMIGDKLLDAATAHHAGATGVLVRTGYGRDEEQRIGAGEFSNRPDAVCDDLAAAAAWWLDQA